MSEDRFSLIARVFDALNRRDWDVLREVMPPGFEFHSTFAAMEGGRVHRGIDEFLSLMESLLSTWGDLRWHLDEVREKGDHSVLLYHVTGVATGSGVPLEQNVAMVWTWQGNSPIRSATFTNRQEALEAAGLSE